MTPQEVIKTLEVAKAEVEWNYPMDYAVAIDEAIKAVEKQEKMIPITYEKAVQAIETLIQVCMENDCSDCPIQNTCSHFILSEPCGWEVVD